MTTTTARPAGTAPRLALSRLAGDLNDEWRRDYEGRRVPAPSSWSADARLARYTAVADALEELEDRATSPNRLEDVLVALTEAASAGDGEATRVVVQYLLPCLVRVAFGCRWSAVSPTPAEALDDLVTVAWETARAGVDLRGRPVRIALLRTIEHRALRQPAREQARRQRREVLLAGMSDVRTRRRGPGDAPVHEDLVADRSGRSRSEPTSAGEDVLALLAAASRAGLSRADAQLVGSLALGWSTCAAVGAAEGVTDRSVRYRRAAALRRLAERAA